MKPVLNYLCRVDLMQLVEEATEGCWIGHRARMFTSEIGSVYSPPKPPDPSRQASNSTIAAAAAAVVPKKKFVETVIDIGHMPSVRLVHGSPFVIKEWS